jgi:plastocyanin
MQTPRLVPLAAVTAILAAAGGLAACGDSTQTIAVSGPPDPGLATAAPAPARGNRITVAATEFAFVPSEVQARPGKVTLTLADKGSMAHELIVLQTGAAPGALPQAGGGRVAERGAVARIPLTGAGGSRTRTLRLRPGRYVYLCNVPGHYASGMEGTLTVK